MKIKELVEKKIISKKHWLTKAKTEDEDVTIVDDTIIWHSGIWNGGTWIDGIWHYGVWNSGTWKDGIWHYGVWHSGTWEKGIWVYGTWVYGTWINGVWQNGTWVDGTWKYGIWKNGLWENGTWENGYREYTQSKHLFQFNTTKPIIRIGGEKRTVDEWDNFFYHSNEVIKTERTDPSFQLILDNYEIVKYIQQKWLNKK